MKKAPLYSRSPRRTTLAAAGPETTPGLTAAVEPGLQSAVPAGRGRAFAQRHAMPLWALGGALLATGLMAGGLMLQPSGPVVTQADIDKAVRVSLEKDPLPSQAAAAYDAIIPSVVRVTSLMAGEDKEDGETDIEQRAMARNLGTGVVIIDDGTILTNLHVVAGAKQILVRFYDGFETHADVVGRQPENDLAVLRAHQLPDDLQPATMRSTGDLLPGDHVIAVGYPFGIGPSASYGVVSGLRREFRSPKGKATLTNLIQFDAAANPGNSGGPLVTMDGQVVGIVTAILNPSDQRTFIGIGFAVPIENAAAAAGMPPF